MPGFLFLEAAVLRCSGKLVHAWLHHKVGSLEGAYWVWGGFVLYQRSMIIFFVDRSPTPKGRSWAAAHPRQWRRRSDTSPFQRPPSGAGGQALASARGGYNKRDRQTSAHKIAVEEAFGVSTRPALDAQCPAFLSCCDIYIYSLASQATN